MMNNEELKTEINGIIKMLMSYGMNKHDSKRCVLKIIIGGMMINLYQLLIV